VWVDCGAVAMGRGGAALLVFVVLVGWWVEEVAGQECNATTACADPTNCCSQYGYCDTGLAYCGAGCQNGPCGAVSPPPPPTPPSPPSPPPPPKPSVSPTPSSGAGRLLTRKLFLALYPNYNKTFYSYDALIVAARAFPKFLDEGCLEQRLRELAAFSAHVQQETSGTTHSSQTSPTLPDENLADASQLQLSQTFLTSTW
jgi:hypothetical protein